MLLVVEIAAGIVLGALGLRVALHPGLGAGLLTLLRVVAGLILLGAAWTASYLIATRAPAQLLAVVGGFGLLAAIFGLALFNRPDELRRRLADRERLDAQEYRHPPPVVAPTGSFASGQATQPWKPSDPNAGRTP